MMQTWEAFTAIQGHGGIWLLSRNIYGPWYYSIQNPWRWTWWCNMMMLPPKATQIDAWVLGTRTYTATSAHDVNQASAAARGHVWVCSPTVARVFVNVGVSYYHWRLCRCLWYGLSPETMLVVRFSQPYTSSWTMYAATQSNEDVWAQATAEGCVRAQVPTAVGCYVDVHGSCYHQRQCRNPGSGQKSETMLVFNDQMATVAMHDSQQLPMPLRWMKRQWRSGKSQRSGVLFFLF